jgi:glycosyltransferase involved in cell wall biosynthesis
VEKDSKYQDNFDTVSVLVPTYNSESVIEDCLKSIEEQTFAPHEIIVCDGGSTDGTVEIAKRHAAKIVETEANRSAQRNTAAQKATGEYLLFVDSDMRLHNNVVAECVACMSKDVEAVVIPEVFIGEGYWAKVRGFERTFYDGIWYLEAARCFRREQFVNMGGFDERLIGPEDWDLDQRLRAEGDFGRINAVIYHYEGHVNITQLLMKKAHYSNSFPLFRQLHPKRAGLSLSPARRFGLLLGHSERLVRHPLLSIGLAILGFAEVLVSHNVFGGSLGMSYSHERAVD